MDRYLIAIDIDGTLLNKDRVISKATKEYLLKLSNEGHLIVLASGRPIRSLVQFHDELKLDTPLICYNGALLFSLNDKNFKTKEYIFKKEVVNEIYYTIKPYIDNAMCETNTDIYIDKVDETLDIFFWYKGMNIHQGEFKDILKEDVITFIAKLNQKGIEHNEEITKRCSRYEGIEERFWRGLPYVELYHKKATKGNALLDIAEYYKIPQKNIISIGDSDNDLYMLQVAGYGVALANAKEFLKSNADIITKKSNHEDGIIEAIEDIFNGKYKPKF